MEAQQGSYGLARFLLAHCVSQFGALGKEPSRARSLGTLGDVLARAGDRAEAEHCYQEGLSIWRDYGHAGWAASFEERIQALKE